MKTHYDGSAPGHLFLSMGNGVIRLRPYVDARPVKKTDEGHWYQDKDGTYRWSVCSEWTHPNKENNHDHPESADARADSLQGQ